VILPQGAAVAQAGTLFEDLGQLPLALSINQPPPCLTGFLPASEWRSPADTSMAPLPKNTYCKIPKDYQGNVVRGARNYPCVDVPGKRAATPMVRGSQPDPVLPGTRRPMRSGRQPGTRCHPGPDGQQRRESGACRPAAPAAVHAADQRSAEPAWPGHRRLQWTTTQPLHLHSGTRAPGLHGRVQPVQRPGSWA
jgi:hypothetical protein